jgi:Fe-Mn family superoxide dismutase
MALTLPPLPYAKTALEPHISEKTLSFHYEKHHQGYLNNLNQLIAQTPFEKQTLEDIITQTAGRAEHMGIFNNAAQVWNHTFYWQCLSPKGGGEPTGQLKQLLEQAFSSLDGFKKEFKQAAVSQFGSGWAWLVWQEERLKILKTPNADLPMAHGLTALMTCDVWEHAYYLDYQNRRPDYVDTFLTHLINWEFVAENLNKARHG